MKRKFLLTIMISTLICASSVAQSVVKVACVGDSITFGVGVEDASTDSYPAQLAQMLGIGYEVQAFGRSGSTLLSHGHNPFIMNEAYTNALEYGADLAVIHLGVNDTDPRNWPDYSDEFVGDYISLIESFRAVNPDMRIIIAKITPITHLHPRFSAGTFQWQEPIRDAIAVVAQAANVELIDFHTPLYHFPQMIPDAVHPNEQGAKIIAEVASKAITGDYGGLQMPMIYSDNMVIQHGEPIEIKGVANASRSVKLSIGGKRYATETQKDGTWSITIDPLQVRESYKMVVESDGRKLTYSNILAGDVWLCAGQSNMEFPLRSTTNSDIYIEKANRKNIRIFNMTCALPLTGVNWTQEQLDSANLLKIYKPTEWQELSSATAADLSAIAYHYGVSLSEELDIPIGLISNAVGGSPVESWVDRKTLSKEYPMIFKDLSETHFMQAWSQGRALVNIKNKRIEQQRHFYEPCYLFEAGIAPLERFPIKGAIWYQGESNATNLQTHEDLFKLMVESWRREWGNDQLPLYYVQLSSLNRTSWPSFRDSQRRLMSQISHTGMAVSSDRGDSLDVHPRRKRDVGERLARWALSETYGCDVTPSGPLFKSAEVVDGAVVIDFEYGDGLRTSDGEPIRTFEVATFDGLYYPAEATVEDGRLVVKSTEIATPIYIRYAWQPFTRANLVNSDGLPASTFKAKIN
ncbi:MAG: GDSL-type esterase/lipase family protein [Rikenellaceae bacterium]